LGVENKNAESSMEKTGVVGGEKVAVFLGGLADRSVARVDQNAGLGKQGDLCVIVHVYERVDFGRKHSAGLESGDKTVVASCGSL